ncbi:MAG TPA: thioredoxin family protein [Dehalococcoidia bacterium]|nr:thioredoxin family protein [Dehalococcoidia bacterium]
MIPLRDQEAIRQRLARDLTSRVRIDYFMQKPSTVYVSGRFESPYMEDIKALLRELAALNNRISLTVHDLPSEPDAAKELGVDKAPAIVVRGVANRAMRYFGIPAGQMFVTFIDAVVAAAQTTVEVTATTAKQLKRLKTDVRLQIFVTPLCEHSPRYVRTAVRLTLASPKIKLDVVEAAEFPQLITRFAVRATPTTVINDTLVLPGALDEATLVENAMLVAEGKQPSGLTRGGPMTPIDTHTHSQAEDEPALRPVGSSGLVIPR